MFGIVRMWPHWVQKIYLVRKTQIVTTNKNIVTINFICFISGGRIFHTATRLNNSNILIYGGRTSPSKPSAETLLLLLEDKNESKSSNCSNGSVNCSSESEPERSGDFQGSYQVKRSYKHSILNCQGDIPYPRWRHSATHLALPDGTSVIFYV